MDEKEETKPPSREHLSYLAYAKAASGEPVIAILRTHLLAEYYLEQLIHLCLARGDKLIESGNLSFYQKLILVESLDVLSDRLVASVKNLNKLRNKCAHELNREISFHDIELLGQPLGPQFTKVKRKLPNTVEHMLGHVLGAICAGLFACIQLVEEQQHAKKERLTRRSKRARKSNALVR